jgi:prepilin-type N-terminal cleavage/methylation domain-containing protein
MTRRGFTLIEVILSIVIIGIIVSFLYGTLGGLKRSNSLLIERDIKLNKNEIFLNLFRRDLLEAKKVSINKSSSQNSILSLETKNSIYNSHYAFVKWLLNPDTNQLIRAESTREFTLPITMEKVHLVRLDIFKEGVEEFLIYQSNDKKGILLSVKDMNTSEMFAIEFGLALFEEDKSNQSNNSTKQSKENKDSNKTAK